MKIKGLVITAILLLSAVFAFGQVSPFMGLGNAQFFDNNGKPLTAGVLYSFQAGTSTQQATFTDSTGTTLNPNPIPFGSGARVSIWLTSGAFYKFVLCLQNDGAFCAPADVLFSVDQVPGSPGGSSGGSLFTGTFVSGSANPSTTGILRLASSDAICWRNAANTANLCITKDSNDILAWAGGAMKFPEIPCVNSYLSFDTWCADNSTHHFKFSGNGGSQFMVPGLGTAASANNFTSFASNGIDIADSGVSKTAPSFTSVTINGVTYSSPATTGQCQIASSASVAGWATCPISVNAPQRVVLGSAHGVSAGVQTTILSETVTFPSASGTYRAKVSYNVWMTIGANVCAAEVIDTTNNVALAASGQNANGTGYIGLAGGETTSQTYTASSTATFTLQVMCNNGAGGLVGATVNMNGGALFAMSPAEPTYLSVTPLLSN